MKEVIIDVDEKGKVLSVKPTTSNYNLVKPSQEDFYDIEDQNGNMDVIDAELKKQSEQITDCKGEIGKVKEQIAGIDVTTDVEDVVTRLVNTDRSTPLNTLINNIKTAITNSITVAKDTIITHVTSQHTTTKNHVNSKVEEVKTLVNSKPSGAIKNVQRGSGSYTFDKSDSSSGSWVYYTDIPISPVNLSKSVLTIFMIRPADAFKTIELISPTVIRVTGNRDYSTGYMLWQVEEYY